MKDNHQGPRVDGIALKLLKETVEQIKGALYRIWCDVNRLGDSGVKVV